MSFMKYKILEYDLKILDSIFEENNEYIKTIISETIEKIIGKAFEKGKIAIVGNGAHARHLQEDFKMLCNADLIDEKYEINNQTDGVDNRTHGYDKIVLLLVRKSTENLLETKFTSMVLMERW